MCAAQAQGIKGFVRARNQASYLIDPFTDFGAKELDPGVEIPRSYDPFADAENSAARGANEYVHIRIQQRNGKKRLTTVQGLNTDFSYDKILKDLKKEFCCNGNVVHHKELGKILQLQGDQRHNVSLFLVHAGLVPDVDTIKIHGF